MRPQSNQLRLMLKTGKTKYYNTYRTTKSMVKLFERNSVIDDNHTLELQQVIYVHRFAGRMSTYFSVSFTYKNGQYSCHSMILLQYKVDFSRIC